MKDFYVVLKKDAAVFHESFDAALQSATERINTHPPGVAWYVFKCLGVAQMPAGPTFTPIADYNAIGVIDDS